MLGYIAYGDGPKRPELGERRLLGGRFVTLRMGQSAHPNGLLARRRALTGARRLWEMGVRSAVFPLDFPYTALFIRQGVCPVDTLPLRQALAAGGWRRRAFSRPRRWWPWRGTGFGGRWRIPRRPWRSASAM